MKKTIGIMGGMGPEATAYFYDLILKNTDAASDQDHIHVIINNYTKVPPRTNAILGTGPSPTPFLIDGIEALLNAGADFIVMPCVTAHCFLPEVQREMRFDFVSLVEESARWVNANYPGMKTAGLVSSSGTLVSRLFHEAFSALGIELAAPLESEQKQVMEAIFAPGGIKSGCSTGPARDAIIAVARRLVERGSEAVIAGCTEVPLVLRPGDLAVPLIEPMRIAAEACIHKAGYRTKPSHHDRTKRDDADA